LAPPHFIHPACPSAECPCPVPPPPADGGLPCPGGLPASPGAAQAWRARRAPGHKGGAACGKPRAARQELLRAEPSTFPELSLRHCQPRTRLCPASSWALGSGFACSKLQGHAFLWGVSRVRLLRRPAGRGRGRACAECHLRARPGPCPPRPPPGVLVKGYLSGDQTERIPARSLLALGSKVVKWWAWWKSKDVTERACDSLGQGHACSPGAAGKARVGCAFLTPPLRAPRAAALLSRQLPLGRGSVAFRPGGRGRGTLPSRAFLLVTKALDGLGPEGKAHSLTREPGAPTPLCTSQRRFQTLVSTNVSTCGL